MAHTGLDFTIHFILFFAFLQDVNLERISCATLDDPSNSVWLEIAPYDIIEPGKIRCKESNCCMGIWNINNGEIQLTELGLSADTSVHIRNCPELKQIPIVNLSCSGQFLTWTEVAAESTVVRLERATQLPLEHAAAGCYPENAVCRSDICVPFYEQGIYHCTCSSDMCNANISFSHQDLSNLNPESALGSSTSDQNRTAIQKKSNKRNRATVFAAPITIILLLSILGFILVRKGKYCLRVRGKRLLEIQELLIQETSSPPTQPVEGLILLQEIREESLAANQWLGALYGEGVIIKCFPPPLKKLYSQEWRILSLLTPLKHENIVCLLAAGSGTEGMLKHHQLLVFQHYPEGSLRSYLTGRTTNWDTACRMAISLARGLAFLHSEKWNGNIDKPAIAHRDLSSDNILVTSDSSCIITDFGLSVVLEESQTKKKPRDPAILNMTGTLRYMSPEMLDGSLNLMSWEQALTQADVYSLGLLLWEIFSRCNDLYVDHQCPAFRVAFSDELGPNPTLDELRSLVVENKRRPQVPRNWSKNLQLLETLWETLEDCWDPDSEARLTAQCAEQRLRNLLLAPFSLLPEDRISSCGNV